MAGRTFERPHLDAALAGRNTRQSHPVLADGTHRSFSNGTGTAHQPPPVANDTRSGIFQSVRSPTLGQFFDAVPWRYRNHAKTSGLLQWAIMDNGLHGLGPE